MSQLPPARVIAKQKSIKANEVKPEVKKAPKKPQFCDDSDDSDDEVYEKKPQKVSNNEIPKKEEDPAPVTKLGDKPKKKIVYVDQSEDSDWGKSSESDDN